MKNLLNKNVIISGASSGIGYHLALNYLECGANVFGLSRSLPDINHEKFKYIKCDLTNYDDITNAVAYICEFCSNIDILINNAGFGISGITELLPIDKVQQNFSLNYFGGYYLTSLILKKMTAGAKVINIVSACALFALPFRGVYCSSKAAQHMFSLSLSMELAHTGIKVLSICPGDIKSNFSKNREKVTITSDRYGDRATRAANKIDSREHKRMDVSLSTKKIFKICASKNKPFYIIGAKYKFLYFAKRILPTNTFIKLTNKMFNK